MSATSYLSDLEKQKIKAFNEDTVLKNAVRKVMLEPLYNQGVLGSEKEHDPTINFALTDAFKMLLGQREMWDMQKLGAITMANARAIQLVEQGFGELEKVKDEPTPTEGDGGVNAL
jgi:hypothetical protein